jgi:hypothetical protein
MERSRIPARQSLGQDWLDALHYWLGGRRGLIALAGLIAVAGVAFSWSWLVAAGMAPLLLGALPCIAMCAIGLCANRMAGRSCSTASSAPDPARLPTADAAPNLSASSERDGAAPIALSAEADAAARIANASEMRPRPHQPQALRERE